MEYFNRNTLVKVLLAVVFTFVQALLVVALISFMPEDSAPARRLLSGGGLLTPQNIVRENSNLYTANNADNLSVGTTSPTSKLHVSNEPVGNGTAATSTFGLGSATTTSRGCINIRNAVGAVSSMYLGAGNTLVIEANACR